MKIKGNLNGHPAKIDPEQAMWPAEKEAAAPAQEPATPGIESAEKEAAAPAQERATPDFSMEPAPPADDLDSLVADPWALQKVSRVSAQRIILACHGHAHRSESGLWCVGLPALTHLGYDRALAGRWLKEAQPHVCDPDLEGGVVVARSGRGWVSVRSTAARPSAAMFLAAVREPCLLRCGDEVAVRVAPGTTREVVHGR